MKVHAHGVDALLSIGEFSRRSGISPSRLRSYAELGVLAAAAVDADTGYRYYSPAQLDVARTIHLLRVGGVAIAEIRDFLRHPSAATLERWTLAVDEEAERRKAALGAVRHHLVAARAEAAPETTRCLPREGTMTTTTSAARSQRGHARKINQDAVAVAPGFAVVADGMGGGPLGERASRLAVEEIQRVLLEGGSLGEGARHANRRIWEEAQADDRLDGMGTTIVAAGFGGGRATVLSVGDSRGYLLRDGLLRQLTSDDSVVADLVRRGALDPTAAAQHPHRHVLTKVLGITADVEPTTVEFAPEAGDRLLLCTDGITNELDDAEIRNILAEASTPAEAVERLFGAVDQVPHADDATAVVIDIPGRSQDR